LTENISGANLGLKRIGDGAENGRAVASINRMSCVRDNDFHTNITLLVRDGIKILTKYSLCASTAMKLGCY
jgi:hypothetical protein